MEKCPAQLSNLKKPCRREACRDLRDKLIQCILFQKRASNVNFAKIYGTCPLQTKIRKYFRPNSIDTWTVFHMSRTGRIWCRSGWQRACWAQSSRRRPCSRRGTGRAAPGCARGRARSGYRSACTPYRTLHTEKRRILHGTRIIEDNYTHLIVAWVCSPQPLCKLLYKQFYFFNSVTVAFNGYSNFLCIAFCVF